MKKVLLFFILKIILLNSLLCQKYYDTWAPIGSIWLYDNYLGLAQPPYATYLPIGYKTIKDTQIQGYSARIIKEISFNNVLDNYGNFKSEINIDTINSFLLGSHILVNKNDSIFYFISNLKNSIFLYKFGSSLSDKFELSRSFKDTIINSDTINYCIKSIVDTMIITKISDDNSFNPKYKVKKYSYLYAQKLLEDNHFILDNIGSMSYLTPSKSTISKTFYDTINNKALKNGCDAIPYLKHFDDHFNSIPIYHLECYYDADTSKRLIANYSFYFDCSKLFSNKTSAIQEIYSSEIIIYPNPVESILNITLDNSIAIYSLEIYSNGGKLIKAFQNLNNMKIDVSTLENGIHILLLLDKNKNVIKKIKFIKK